MFRNTVVYYVIIIHSERYETQQSEKKKKLDETVHEDEPVCMCMFARRVIIGGGITEQKEAS